MAMVAHQRRIVARHQPHPFAANELHEQIVGEVVVPRRDRPTRPDPEEALACAAAFQDAGNLADIAEQRREHVAILVAVVRGDVEIVARLVRSEEHTSELQSLMRSSYAVFCCKKKKNTSHT